MRRIHNSKITHRVAAFICGLCLIFVLLITAAQAVCYWIPGWWRAEYAKYDTPSNVNGEMSLDDAVSVTEDMLDYCIGRLDSLDGSMATIDGVEQPFFTEREKSHLYDCRVLFGKAIRARLIAILLFIALAIYIYMHNDYGLRSSSDDGRLQDRRQDNVQEDDPDDEQDHESDSDYRQSDARDGRLQNYGQADGMYDASPQSGISNTLRIMSRGYLLALSFTAALAIVIGILCAIDFTYVFTEFHHIFFDNDLWILYPDKDNLINIMQEDVFFDAAKWIAAIWLAACALIAAAAVYISKKTEKQ